MSRAEEEFAPRACNPSFIGPAQGVSISEVQTRFLTHLCAAAQELGMLLHS